MLAAWIISLFYNRFLRKIYQSQLPFQVPQPLSSSQKIHNKRTTRRGKAASASSFKGPRVKQPYEVFLVLDIEGTCNQDTGFNYPNEIIVRANDILGKYHLK